MYVLFEAFSGEVLQKTRMEYILDFEISELEYGRIGADPPMSCINERAIRYADVLLLLAESYLRGKQDLPMAIGYLNQIRERANLNPYSGAQTYELSLMIWSVSVPSSSLWKGNVFTIFAVGDCWKSVCRLVMKFGNKQLMTGKVGDTNRYYYYPIPSKELETNPLCTPNELVIDRF